MPEHMARWADGDEPRIPGSETHVQAGDRFAAALQEHVGDLGADETLVVVVHGGVAGSARARSWGSRGRRGSRSADSTTARGPCSRRRSRAPRMRWRIVEWNAGTLPEPVMSDDERPGLGRSSASG